MASCKYTTDRIRTRKAIAQVIKLQDKIYRPSGTLSDAKFTKASDRLQYLLLLLRYRGVDTSRPPLTMRPFLRAKIIKSCVYLSVILWYPTPQVSFALFTVLNSVFFCQLFLPPNIHSVSNPCNISVGHVFW